MPQSVIVFVRGLLAFVSLLIMTRMMGKKQVSQLTFFDYVTGITIGSIASSMTVDLDIEAVSAWVGMIVWTLGVVLVSFIAIKSRVCRKIVDGEPTLVVQNGQILERNMRKLGYNLDDLLMQLREGGTFSLAEVEFALLESNGELSVLKKSQHQPVTPADLGIPTDYKGLSVEVVMDGKVIDANLKQMQLNKAWLDQQVRARNHKLEDVFYAEIDTSGQLYIDLYDDFQDRPQNPKVTDRKQRGR